MPFRFNQIESVEFGVCTQGDEGESYRLVPCDRTVQAALEEMLEETRLALRGDGEQIQDFSPAEKYGSTERLRIPLNSDLVAKYKSVYEANNLATDANGLANPGILISYFATFRDRAGAKLMAFRRAAQFKGVVRKQLVHFINDALRIVPDQVFKLDTDFDFLIFDGQILIWRPSGFVFTADIDGQIAASAAQNVAQISKEIGCIDFEAIGKYVGKHKLAMRLVAALKTRDDLGRIGLPKLRAACKLNSVKFKVADGKLYPEPGHEMDLLLILDRRLYTMTLIEAQPETYQAASRTLSQRAVVAE